MADFFQNELFKNPGGNGKPSYELTLEITQEHFLPQWQHRFCMRWGRIPQEHNADRCGSSGGQFWSPAISPANIFNVENIFIWGVEDRSWLKTNQKNWRTFDDKHLIARQKGWAVNYRLLCPQIILHFSHQEVEYLFPSPESGQGFLTLRAHRVYITVLILCNSQGKAKKAVEFLPRFPDSLLLKRSISI